MDDFQRQFRPVQRVAHSPPLVNGDTATVADPYATSLYGGPIHAERSFELGPGAGQMYSHLHAPTGSRSFEQYDNARFDSSFSYQNQSFWDSLATDFYREHWSLAGDLQEFPALESDPSAIPVPTTIVPSDTYSLQMHEEVAHYVNPRTTSNIPYIHDDPGMYWRHNQRPSDVVGENPYHWIDSNREEMDRDLADDFAPIMGQTDMLFEFNPQLPDLDENLGDLPGQNSLRWAPIEMGASYRRGKSASKAPSTSRIKGKMRKPTPWVLTFRSRSKRPVLGSVSARNPQAQDACVACRITKRRCNDVDPRNRCSQCRQSGKYCLSTKNLLPIWNLPDIYTETPSVSPTPPLAATESPRIYRASIYVSSSTGKLGVPLCCKVSEQLPASDVAPRSSMVWENLRSTKTDKNCVQKERLESCCIPRTCMPSADTLLEWAVNSMQQLTSGVVRDYYSPLYTFAANYVRVGKRPLYDLVALTLFHSAIYDVCHSRMTIVFDKRQQAHISVPLGLRAQICRPLFQLFEVTGAEIHQMLISALHGLAKRERLAFRIVNWLLVLTYEHCLRQTLQEIFGLRFIGKTPESNLTERKDSLECVVEDLRGLHKAVFKKTPDFADRSFDASWKGDENDEDDHELKVLLVNLRTAMVEHQLLNVREIPESLGRLAPQLYSEAALNRKPDASESEDARTVSTSKKVDFDNMSADTGLDNGDGDQPLSRPQAIQKVLQNLKNQHI